MTEITITPIGEPAEHKSKFGFLHTVKEIRQFSQFPFMPQAGIRCQCDLCGAWGQEKADFLQKYREYTCGTCGAKRFIAFIVPDANHAVQSKQARLLFYEN